MKGTSRPLAINWSSTAVGRQFMFRWRRGIILIRWAWRVPWEDFEKWHPDLFRAGRIKYGFHAFVNFWHFRWRMQAQWFPQSHFAMRRHGRHANKASS